MYQTKISYILNKLRSPSCGSSDRNSFSITLDKISLNQKGKWSNRHNSYKDYGHFHSTDGLGHYSTTSNRMLLVSLNDGAFFVTGTIEGGCTPVLRIRLFHNIDSYPSNFFKGLKNRCQPYDNKPVSEKLIQKTSTKTTTSKQETTGKKMTSTITDEYSVDPELTEDAEKSSGDPETTSLETKFMLWVGLAVGGLLLVIVIIVVSSFLAKRRRKNRRFRQP
jgi:hypothetical protein